MPRHCSVFGCKSNYESESERVSTFRLPKDKNHRNVWLRNIPTDISKLKDPVVCIKHFDESCIVRVDRVTTLLGETLERPRSRPKLSDTAVPTIFSIVIVNNKTAKIEIKEEDPVSASENDAELLDQDCDVTVKTEIEDPVIKIEEYSSDNEIEIKDEPWWLQTETSSLCYDTKDADLGLEEPARLCKEPPSGDNSSESPLYSAEDSEKYASLYNATEHSEFESDLTKELSAEKHIHPELCGKCDVDKMTNKCKVCERNFTHVTHLKNHILGHEVRKPHKCKICDKIFTKWSDLKNHNWIHEGKKPHRCHVCGKTFTRLSNLKSHNLIHKGIKPHKCKLCEMGFTKLTYLKSHYTTHEGKKPHKCGICEKRFTRMSHLKTHTLIHEGKKPHSCKICDKKFTALSDLKKHNLIHEGKKPHRCKICGKRFTVSSHLKSHNLIHEGTKPHCCQICDKSFRFLSSLKRHNLKIHHKV